MGFFAFLDPSADPAELTGHVVDLGSGAGLPALPLADHFPATTWTLIERRTSRAELLTRAVRRLGLTDRIEVWAVDAADAAWTSLRGDADWVTARAFGPPSDVAEIGGPILRVGGSLLVSEPRSSDLEVRWPREGVARCGLAVAESWETPAGRYVRLVREPIDVPDLPRRGARKRPLF